MANRRGLLELMMRILEITKASLQEAKKGVLPASIQARYWPIGSTLKLVTIHGDEVQAEVVRIEPRGTAYNVHLTNIRTIREGNADAEHKPGIRRGVRPWGR